MLLAFRLENFRSFRDQAELSLAAHPADKTIQSCLINPKLIRNSKIRLLPAAAIYGANSAGKTNVLKGFNWLRTAILDSQTQWAPNSGTRISRFGSQSNLRDVSTFEIECILKGIRYVYKVTTNATFIEEETFNVFSAGRERNIFMRRISNYVEQREEKRIRSDVQYQLEFQTKTKADEQYYDSITRKVRENSLVISAAAQDNQPECRRIYEWLQDQVEIDNIAGARDRSHAMHTAAEISVDDSLKRRILSLMQVADPQLADIEIHANSEITLPETINENVSEEMKRRFLEDFRFRVLFISDNVDGRIRLPLEAQSRGFQKLFSLSVRILSALQNGHLFVIDELESSIHPHLARFIVDLFQSPETNRGGQIVFTTHDTNLLDQSLLRRDQIWFAEKDECCSRLYSLLDFKPRKDDNLERGYLRGKYGAVPALGFDPESLASTI